MNNLTELWTGLHALDINFSVWCSGVHGSEFIILNILVFLNEQSRKLTGQTKDFLDFSLHIREFHILDCCNGN